MGVIEPLWYLNVKIFRNRVMPPSAAGVAPYCGLRAALQAGKRLGARSAGVNSLHLRRFKETDPSAELVEGRGE